MYGYVYRWRTASKAWTCAEAYQWAHAGRINPGDRYLVITALQSDIVPFGSRTRLCALCATGQPDAPPDPKEA
jgi:hypothetical protein